MLHIIEEVNNSVNAFIWGVPSMVCIIGVGLLLTIRTKGLQFRKFGYVLKHTFGTIFDKKEAEEGALTPFQSVCTALAGTVGTGNIAGVAGAIALGGPGAVFWMWCSALLGMCTKFAEVTLAVHFRERNDKGDWVGGPMYYIKNGLGKKWQFLAVLYSILGILTVFGTGNATQVNTIVASIDSALFNFNVFNEDNVGNVNLGIGILIAVLVLLILLGGIKRIGNVTSKLVPFMAVFYIVMGLILVAVNYERVPEVFKSIFEGAFNPRSVTGGVVGSLFISMRRGVSRGIFSNEAGLGTGSIAHASSDVAHPIQQGMWGHSLQRNQHQLRKSCRCRAHHQRFHHHLRGMDFHPAGGSALLLCLLHHPGLGTVRLPLHRIPLRTEGRKTLHYCLRAGGNHRCHHGPGPALVSGGYLQRFDDYPELDCGIPAFRHGNPPGKGLFSESGIPATGNG